MEKPPGKKEEQEDDIPINIHLRSLKKLLNENIDILFAGTLITGVLIQYDKYWNLVIAVNGEDVIINPSNIISVSKSTKKKKGVK